MKVKRLIEELQRCDQDFEVQLSVPNSNYLDLNNIEEDDTEEVVFLESS